ncbi:hypothetical protein ZIOFF_060348 [Zingiber officinale]|uniref:PIN-like protein n=1 Tax=Zingiber officinale TaxID=94328 RepID=A0A8J5FEI2_ZINOF|nr:hypothetical protein ZIOFF_060348 [Zingiber officinale]
MLGVAWNDNCNCTVLCTTLSDVTRLQLDIVHAMASLLHTGSLNNLLLLNLALAIIIGAIPFLKNFILTDDAPLFFFTDSCLILGEAMIPCILLALGGNLVDGMQSSISYNVTCYMALCCVPGSGPGSKRLGLQTTAAIIFGRLVLVPPTGLGIITIADKLGLFPRGDKMFKFVLLLQHTMPERYGKDNDHTHKGEEKRS